MGTLARGSLIVIGVEAAVLAVLGMRLAQSDGIVSAIVSVAAIALGWRVILVLLTYAIAVACASRVPSAYRIGMPQLLAHAGREAAACTAVFSVLQPFERWTARSRPTRAHDATKPPVLLVHGYLCNRAVWRSIGRALEARGHAVHTVDLEPVFGGIDGYVPLVAERIEAVCATARADRLIYVGHSMGGLVARAYLDAHGPGRLDRVITLGSPHAGTMLAWLGLGANARDMRPGSAFLERLRANEAVAFPLPFTSIFSWHDNFVAPQASARLKGAREIPLKGIGHLTMLFAREVREAVIGAVEAPGERGD